ncbi:hypothetical protein Y10_01280 [Neptunitalea sp. Y10]|uniref:HEAT repeat domain-containing protein n=2 Tax=Neptunitalea lumnitzerae TaxID=2965509 RepID=A0ABQ5MEF6_9FLAO|nr:hypothetical protein Y10_01280 [Neptunitalea sp. Y10]
MISSLCSAQETVATPVSTLVNKLAKENIVMGSAIGDGGSTPTQYKTYTKLKAAATPNELVMLTNHTNGVVRCYAFWALYETNYTAIIPQLKAHLNDDEIIKTQFGCMIERETVANFILRRAKSYITYEDCTLPNNTKEAIKLLQLPE